MRLVENFFVEVQQGTAMFLVSVDVRKKKGGKGGPGERVFL